MGRPRIYLAGPIRDMKYDDAVLWRRYVGIELGGEFELLSPMRGKDLTGEEAIKDAYEGDDPVLSSDGIVKRDAWDVRRCDLLLANFLYSTRQSIGTIWEIGYASALQKPIIVAIQKDNPNYHPFITVPALYVVDHLDKAIALVKMAFYASLD